MRKILVLLTVLLVGYVAVNRQRIYLRDPLGVVTRDGVKVDGARVFINYSNDALVQVGGGLAGASGMTEFLVQGWNGVVGVPEELQCVQGMACLAGADHAAVVPLAGATKAVMTGREIAFSEQKGTVVQVRLR